jgi:hypothetical protein
VVIYSSSVGDSFLALPKDIQWLTGNTPTMTMTLVRDITRPVYLIIKTTRSVVNGIGCHGWVISTSDAEIFMTGGGMDEVDNKYMHSYHSEISGAFIVMLAQLGHIHI